jgi:hypothetical protein
MCHHSTIPDIELSHGMTLCRLIGQRNSCRAPLVENDRIMPPSASLLVRPLAACGPTGHFDHPTARRHPVKAAPFGRRSAPLAFRSAPALTRPRRLGGYRGSSPVWLTAPAGRPALGIAPGTTRDNSPMTSRASGLRPAADTRRTGAAQEHTAIPRHPMACASWRHAWPTCWIA